MINLPSLLPVSRQKTWVQAFSEGFDYFPKKQSKCGCGKTPCESCKEHNVTDVDVNNTTLVVKEWKSFDCLSQVTDFEDSGSTMNITETFPRQI